MKYLKLFEQFLIKESDYAGGPDKVLYIYDNGDGRKRESITSYEYRKYSGREAEGKRLIEKILNGLKTAKSPDRKQTYINYVPEHLQVAVQTANAQNLQLVKFVSPHNTATFLNLLIDSSNKPVIFDIPGVAVDGWFTPCLYDPGSEDGGFTFRKPHNGFISEEELKNIIEKQGIPNEYGLKRALTNGYNYVVTSLAGENLVRNA
jgi:hypothetical protein